MNFFSLITAFYIGLLSVMPALEVTAVLPEVLCCQDKDQKHECNEEHEGENEKEQGCSDLCNPFLSCRCAIGFTIGHALLAMNNHQWASDAKAEIKNFIPFLFSPQIWNPPKVKIC